MSPGRPRGSMVRRARVAPVDPRELGAYMLTIGRRIRDRREEIALSAAAVAESAGLNVSHLLRLERGAVSQEGRKRHGVMLQTLVAIARALRINPSELMP